MGKIDVLWGSLCSLHVLLIEHLWLSHFQNLWTSTREQATNRSSGTYRQILFSASRHFWSLLLPALNWSLRRNYSTIKRKSWEKFEKKSCSGECARLPTKLSIVSRVTLLLLCHSNAIEKWNEANFMRSKCKHHILMYVSPVELRHARGSSLRRRDIKEILHAGSTSSPFSVCLFSCQLTSVLLLRF